MTNFIVAIAAADIICAIVMILILSGLLSEKNKSRSTKALIATFLSCIFNLLVDAGCYVISGPNVANTIVLLMWTLAYSMSLFTESIRKAPRFIYGDIRIE